MSRLITYGCSYTYGQGLEDCYEPHTHPDKIGQFGPGPNPSNFAWPAHLGRLMRVPVENRARPGAGNKEILWRILNHEHREDDVVVILWSHVDRHCIVSSDDMDEWPEQFGWWVSTSLSKAYLDYAVKTHNKYDRFIESYMFIELANYFLGNTKKVLNYAVRPIEWLKMPAWSRTKIISYANDIWADYPKAEDGGHPGKIGQRKFAQKIYGDMLR